MINKLVINLLLLPGFMIQTSLSCVAQTKLPNLNKYKVINATTLVEHTTGGAYTGEENEQTHIITTSAIKEALINEGVEPSAIEILLYFDYVSISDDLPQRQWDSKPKPNTISSPWLELTETVNSYGENKIVVRIDATYARLIYDLFSKHSSDTSNANDFLEIPSIRSNCLGQAIRSYPPVRLNSPSLTLHEFSDSFDCVPEQLREPLLSLFKSSKQDFIGSFEFPVFRELEYHCQGTAREYYRELYPQLAVQALKILKSSSELESEWWTEIVKDVKPVQRCPKPTNNQFDYSY